MVDIAPGYEALSHDLLQVDLRGEDLSGADLRNSLHIALAELVALEDGEWQPLAAWDSTTLFPRELEELLLLMNLLSPELLEDQDWREEAMERGRHARRIPIDKSQPGILETQAGRWSDG